MKTDEILQQPNPSEPEASEPENPVNQANEPKPQPESEQEPLPNPNPVPMPDAPSEEAPVPEAANEPETVPEKAPALGVPAAEVERLVAEAYRKGRNESIAELMAKPGLLQPAGCAVPAVSATPDEGFLSNLRPSIWDL